MLEHQENIINTFSRTITSAYAYWSTFHCELRTIEASTQYINSSIDSYTNHKTSTK